MSHEANLITILSKMLGKHPPRRNIKRLNGHFRPQKHAFKSKKTAIFSVFLQKIKYLARPDPKTTSIEVKKKEKMNLKFRSL
jgi:hypothetical protein